MTFWQCISMFFLSFTPLWVSVLIVDIKSIIENETPLLTEIISVVLILLVWGCTACILLSSLNKKIEKYKEMKEGSLKYKLKTVEEQKSITAEYLLSYILPLFAFDFTRWDQVILFLVYFSTLGYLCIRHNQISVNIVLELSGYRFYKCELLYEQASTLEKYIISKEKLINHENHEISTIALNNEYLLDLMDWK